MTSACARQGTRGALQRSGWLLFLLLVALGCSPDQSAPREQDVGKATSTAPRPNILLIVVDDMGYSDICLLYTSPSPRDVEESRMPSSA